MVCPFISPELYAWVILPLLIFLARILDVSMETIRVVFISRGIRLYATGIAFVEIVIWLLAVEVVMRDLSNLANFLAFTCGFAAGTYTGLLVEERLSLGMVIIRIITAGEPVDAIISFLRAENHGVTTLGAKGSRGDVSVIVSLVKRREVSRIVDHIKTWNPRAFFSIEDVKNVHEGIFRQGDAGSVPERLRALLGPGKQR